MSSSRLARSSGDAAFPAPARLYVEVTRACPLSCLHCYADAGPPRADEMTPADFSGWMAQAAAMRIREVILSGGEPLARKDIFELVDIARQRGLGVVLLTSGVVMDPGIAHSLAARDVETRLSLDGVSAATHDLIRGEGNLAKVIAAAAALRVAGVRKLSAHFTVNRRNVGDILRLPAFLADLAIGDVVISTIKPAGRALGHPELLVGAELMPLVRNRIRIVSRARHLTHRVHQERSWGGMGCPAAHTKCGITSDGRVTPCVFLGEAYEGGTLREQPLHVLWESDARLKSLRALSSKACPSKLGGGCRSRALYHSGSLGGDDPYCSESERLETRQGAIARRIREALRGGNVMRAILERLAWPGKLA